MTREEIAALLEEAAEMVPMERGETRAGEIRYSAFSDRLRAAAASLREQPSTCNGDCQYARDLRSMKTLATMKSQAVAELVEEARRWLSGRHHGQSCYPKCDTPAHVLVRALIAECERLRDQAVTVAMNREPLPDAVEDSHVLRCDCSWSRGQWVTVNQGCIALRAALSAMRAAQPAKVAEPVAWHGPLIQSSMNTSDRPVCWHWGSQKPQWCSGTKIHYQMFAAPPEPAAQEVAEWLEMRASEIEKGVGCDADCLKSDKRAGAAIRALARAWRERKGRE